MKKIKTKKRLKISNPIPEGLISAAEKIEERIPESQGDIADRAEEEIESDIRWRVERIRRATREDYTKRAKSKRSLQ